LHDQILAWDFVLGGLANGILGLRQALQLNIGPGKIVPSRGKVRIESDSSFAIFDRLFILAEQLIDP
jgi:hypothetical protein